MARPNKKGLSSADSSTEMLSTRVPGELAAAVRTLCEEQGISPAELLRSIVESHVYGKTGGLSGPDDGYRTARSMASQIAHALLGDAIAKLPETHDEMVAMLQTYYKDLAAKRKR
jgi:hypothetical protein